MVLHVGGGSREPGLPALWAQQELLNLFQVSNSWKSAWLPTLRESAFELDPNMTAGGYGKSGTHPGCW